MGAPIGNQNAAKAKRWTAAIERALARRASGSRPEDGRSELMQGVDAAADEFVSLLFAAKDLGYFKELGDRMDGKPAQALALTGEEGGPVQFEKIVREIVRPSNPNG